MVKHLRGEQARLKVEAEAASVFENQTNTTGTNY